MSSEPGRHHPEERADGSRRRILFFGDYDPLYPRNAIIRKGCRDRGIGVIECRAGSGGNVLTRYPRLLAAFLRNRHSPSAPVFVPDFRHKDMPLAWTLARLTGRKVVFDPLVSRYETRVLDRGDAARGSLQARHNRNIDMLSMRAADLLLADTDAHADFYSKEFGLDRRKVRTLYLGFDDSVFGPSGPPPEGEGLRVLFYGSFLPLHGVETIIEAAGSLRGEGVKLTVVGGGQTMPEARRLARDAPEGNVRFVDTVEEKELPALIGESDVVLGIFGTTAKARMVIPNKVFQGMASSRPVITADTPAVREIFEPGRHLVTVPPGDPGALARAMRLLRDDRALSARLAREGGDLVRREYAPVSVAGRMAGLLEEAGIW